MPAVTAGWSGESKGWRYLAQRIDGTGTPGAFIHTELPLDGVQLTDVLSGPPQLTATISPALRQMKGSDGLPLLSPWKTAIHAEADGVIRGSFLVAGQQFSGPDLTLDCTGYTSMLKGRYWPGVTSYRQVEPLNVVRDIWNTIQGHWGSNLNMIVDSTTMTGAKLGAPVAPTVTATTSTSAGTVATSDETDPYILAWYETHDLAGEIDQLSADFGFEYHERHVWNAAKTDVLHFLDFGYPAWGRRREGLRFVLGENIQTETDLAEDGDEYANHVVVLGAGEGTKMIKGEAAIHTDGRIRRMAVISDDTITTTTRATRAAQLELARLNQLTRLDSAMIKNTRMAPLGSYGVGDEIYVQSDADWRSYKAWHRITSMTINPDNPDLVGVSLVRSDWV